MRSHEHIVFLKRKVVLRTIQLIISIFTVDYNLKMVKLCQPFDDAHSFDTYTESPSTKAIHLMDLKRAKRNQTCGHFTIRLALGQSLSGFVFGLIITI